MSNTKFKLQNVIASLVNEEIRKASSQLSDESSQALTIGDTGRSQHKDQSSRFNRGRSQSRERSKSQGRKAICWYCKKDGHTRKDCWAMKNKEKNKDNIDNGDANSISDGEGMTLSVRSLLLKTFGF